MVDPADPWSNPMTLVIVVVGPEVTEAERRGLAGLTHESWAVEPVEVAGSSSDRPGG